MKDPWDSGVPRADTIWRYSHIDMVDSMDTVDGELKGGADVLPDIQPRYAGTYGMLCLGRKSKATKLDVVGRAKHG